MYSQFMMHGQRNIKTFCHLKSCKTPSVKFREERGLKIFENRVLMRELDM